MDEEDQHLISRREGGPVRIMIRNGVSEALRVSEYSFIDKSFGTNGAEVAQIAILSKSAGALDRTIRDNSNEYSRESGHI